MGRFTHQDLRKCALFHWTSSSFSYFWERKQGTVEAAVFNQGKSVWRGWRLSAKTEQHFSYIWRISHLTLFSNRYLVFAWRTTSKNYFDLDGNGDVSANIALRCVESLRILRISEKKFVEFFRRLAMLLILAIPYPRDCSIFIYLSRHKHSANLLRGLFSRFLTVVKYEDNVDFFGVSGGASLWK